MKRKITQFSLLIAMLFIANSCAPSTPATRIAKNPAMFESLSKSDKELAQIGQIKRGMHKNGVLIAWGKPHGFSAGDRNGKSFEQWVYTSTTPVYTNTLRPYAFYGYSRFGYGGGRYYDGYYNGFEFGPEVHYVRENRATVEFDHTNKVSNWMRLK